MGRGDRRTGMGGMGPQTPPIVHYVHVQQSNKIYKHDYFNALAYSQLLIRGVDCVICLVTVCADQPVAICASSRIEFHMTLSRHLLTIIIIHARALVWKPYALIFL